MSTFIGLLSKIFGVGAAALGVCFVISAVSIDRESHPVQIEEAGVLSGTLLAIY